MQRKLAIAAALLLVAFAGTSALGGTYYVATNGSDSNPGSSTQPWLTLQHAVDTIANGDTILVKPGTYNGCRIRYTAAAGSPKTLAAETAGTVLINAPGALAYRPSCIEVIHDDHGYTPVDYWVIDGFEVTSSPKWGIDAILANHLTVTNNVAHNNGSLGMYTGIHLAFGDYMLVENNTSYSNTEHGLYCNNGADYGIARNNTLYSNGSMGFHMNGDSEQEGSDGIMTDWLVEKNKSYNNTTNGFDGDGVEYTTWKNNLTYGNVSKSLHLFVLNGEVNPRYLRIVNNTFINKTGSYYVLNFYLNKKTSKLPGGNDNKIFNNILYHYETTNTMRGSIMGVSTWMSTWESDYNLVVDRFAVNDNKTKYTLAQWRSTYGLDLNSTLCLDLTQAVVDAANDDYHLKATGPAVNAGTTLTDVTDDIEGTSRPQGTAYDIGCYEYH